MTAETNYEAELRAANEELYKHSLELARLKEELEISKQQELEKVQEVARLKDEFVFLAIHELRTPIAAIRGFLELTESAQEHFPQDIQKNLQAISEASTHINQLVNDLLEIARNDSGASKVEVSAAAFQPILEDTLHELSSLVKQREIRMTTLIDPMPPILCDAAKLKEVLLNLLSNAIKYNRTGGEINISAYDLKGENKMLCEIRDTGYGIPKDQQEKIFQKFFRAVSHETQAVIGTGLGLFITRMLIEKMGGTLLFTSVEHEGTTFSFTLPFAK